MLFASLEIFWWQAELEADRKMKDEMAAAMDKMRREEEARAQRAAEQAEATRLANERREAALQAKHAKKEQEQRERDEKARAEAAKVHLQAHCAVMTRAARRDDEAQG